MLRWRQESVLPASRSRQGRVNRCSVASSLADSGPGDFTCVSKFLLFLLFFFFVIFHFFVYFFILLLFDFSAIG